MFSNSAHFALLGMILSLMNCGCTAHRAAAHQPQGFERPSTAPNEEITVIGLSVEARPIEAITLGSGPKTILYIATIHGNESAGTPLLQCFAREIKADPALISGFRVVLVPVANPDGLAHRRRTNAHGIDLNRNFSAANFTDHRRHGPQPFSEPETRALATLIDEFHPTAIISIHQPLACIDFDGPAETMARGMSTASLLPVNKLGAQPGSLGSYAGVERDIAIVTLELPGGLSRVSDDELWNRYRAILLVPLSSS